MSIEDVISHNVRICSGPAGTFVNETYFFMKEEQTYVFEYDLDDRPKIVQHCCAISRDINRKDSIFYEHMFNLMIRFLDLTKLSEDSSPQ